MKQLFLFGACLLMTAAAFAQPTLTGATSNAVPGEGFIGHYCDTTGVTAGASGAGVTWNYASLTETQADTTIYAGCTGTLYCDSFPGSTLSTNDGMGYYEYYVTDATKFGQTGSGDSYGLEYYSKPLNLMMYPMTYGTLKLDTAVVAEPTYGDYTTYLDTLAGDGYGTLILPSGTYTNALRVHFVTILIDSSNYLGTPSVDTAREDLYMWWTPGFHNPLLLMGYDTSAGASYLSNVIYYTQAPTLVPSSIKGLNSLGGVSIYPNPAADEVHIRYTATGNEQATISLTDMVGRTVGERLVENVTAGVNTINYSVASLPPGVYLMRIQTATNSVVRQITVGK